MSKRTLKPTTRLYWYASTGAPLYLKLTLEQAQSCAHSGQCDVDVEDLYNDPKILRQIGKWPNSDVKDELAEYGCWNDEELADPVQNEKRLLWIACGDLIEEIFESQRNL